MIWQMRKKLWNDNGKYRRKVNWNVKWYDKCEENCETIIENIEEK
jgi:hypothetical protein